MTKRLIEQGMRASVSRRTLLQGGAGLIGGAVLSGGLMMPAMAAGQDPIGTWPAGSRATRCSSASRCRAPAPTPCRARTSSRATSSRSSTSTTGHELIKKISPKTKKGVLGKEVKLGVADSAAKPNEAVQAQQRFISENKAVMITGGTSSAVAVALNKLAQREKVLFVCGISGSNDTTGKDCVRYGVRQNFYGQTAAHGDRSGAAQGIRQGQEGRVHDARLHLRPHRHEVDAGLSSPDAGWTTVTNQVSPLGAPDFSSYLLNIANSGADVLINVNWGHDAVLSIQQAKQFGVLDKMKLVVPYQMPFLARETGGLMQGVYAATDFWWTLEDKYPLAKMFIAAFEKKYGYKPEWGAENAYISFAHWARMVEEAGSFYPPDVIKAYEKGETIRRWSARCIIRKEDHQLRPPGHHRQGQGSRRT